VSPTLNWFPIVTFLQLSFDLTLAQTAPVGHGHLYAPQHYLDAWVAVTDPPGWDEISLAALRQKIEPNGRAQRHPGRMVCGTRQHRVAKQPLVFAIPCFFKSCFRAVSRATTEVTLVATYSVHDDAS
jgi:hypothetical protein